MAIKFTNRTTQLGVVEYQIKKLDDTKIGNIEGALKDGCFICNLIIDIPFHKKSFGFKAFEMMYKEMNMLNPVQIIKGSWHKSPTFAAFSNGMSTNLEKYLESRIDQNQIDSAFSTPTGKWAKKLGFTKCKIITDIPNHVEVDFTR